MSLLLNGGVALGLNIVSFTVSLPTAREPEHTGTELIAAFIPSGQQKGRRAHHGRVCKCQAGPDDRPVSFRYLLCEPSRVRPGI